MKRFGGIGIIMVAAVLLQAAPSVSARSSTADVLNAANAARAQHGLRPLRASSALMRSAQMKAAEILRCNSFSHTPCGTAFVHTFQLSGYFRGRVRVGENLYWATGSLGSAAAAINAWLHSPPHRANLLGRWRDGGVGILHADSLFGYHDVWLFVLEFGLRG